MKKNLIRCLFVLFVLVVGSWFAIKHPTSRMVISEFDYTHLNGLFFDALGKDFGSQKSDLQLYKDTLKKADYDWLIPQPIWVAHGLGREGTLNNSEAAFDLSLDAGFKYFEVDLSMINNKLVCAHHQHPYKDNPCTFEVLMSLAQKYNVWFILDVKSNFQEAYSVITKNLKGSGVGKKFIPQIYQFNQIKHLDLELFSGPLFTAYRRNQSGPFLLKTATKLLLPAITLPPEKLSSIKGFNKIRVFTHNVNDIANYEKYKSIGVSGFYIREPFYRILKSNE